LRKRPAEKFSPKCRAFSNDRVVERDTNVLSGTGAVDLSGDFDQIAVVVDWLDACRRRDLEALLELYADGASAVCDCSGMQLH